MVQTFTANVYLAAKKSGLGGLAECSMMFRNIAMRPNFGFTAPENQHEIENKFSVKRKFENIKRPSDTFQVQATKPSFFLVILSLLDLN